MGAAMARSAARGGLNATAWDRSSERAPSFASGKVQIAQCTRDAVQNAEIVVTMVSNADAVLSIMKERVCLDCGRHFPYSLQSMSPKRDGPGQEAANTSHLRYRIE